MSAGTVPRGTTVTTPGTTPAAAPDAVVDPTYDATAVRSAAVVVRAYSTSFGWACRLLGDGVRDHVRAVYALVRVADEIVDDPRPGLSVAERGELLDELEREVARARARGRSSNLVVHAFARTARRFGIGDDLVAPFFASMRSDLTVTAYDEAGFAAYVHGSAEVVGLMCLRVFVAGDDAAYERLAPGAARLGAAFQKVNFLRDLADDAGRLGRSYIPGLDPQTFTDRDKAAVVDEIAEDLAVAREAIARLPRGSRRATTAAAALFGRLNEQLRETPAAALRTTRVSVPLGRKLGILANAAAGRTTA